MNKPPPLAAVSFAYTASRFSLPRPSAPATGGVLESESATPITSLPISKELVGLTEDELDSQIIPRTFWRKKTLTGKSLLGEGNDDDEEEREKDAWRRAGRGVTFTAMGGQSQSSGHQEDRQHLPFRAFDNEKNMAAGSTEEAQAGFISQLEVVAARLPERCAEHYAIRGADAMRLFLSSVFIMLMPALIRDLAAKLQVLNANTPSLGLPHTARPIFEVCEKLQAVMRPICDQYLAGPFPILEARVVLCSAQAAMMDEVRAGSDTSPRLRQIMVETLNPLLAILIMACLSRPSRLEHKGPATGVVT